MLSKDSEFQVDNLISKLKRRFIFLTRQVTGSLEVTLETAKLLRNIIAGSRWNDHETLVDIVNTVQDKLSFAQPIGTATINKNLQSQVRQNAYCTSLTKKFWSSSKRMMRILRVMHLDLGNQCGN